LKNKKKGKIKEKGGEKKKFLFTKSGKKGRKEEEKWSVGKIDTHRQIKILTKQSNCSVLPPLLFVGDYPVCAQIICLFIIFHFVHNLSNFMSNLCHWTPMGGLFLHD
jgi:hypothetical protein